MKEQTPDYAVPPITADDALRIAIGQPNGRRSATWRIWFGPNDIYAAFRSLANVRKATIHYPRPPKFPDTLRYIGFTREYSEEVQLPISVDQRAHAVWSGAHLGNGYEIEFRFRIPECELRRFTSNEDANTHWLNAPPTGAAAEVLILSGPPHHSGLVPQRADHGEVELVADFRLKNGRHVWVMHHDIPIDRSWLQSLRQQIRAEHLPHAGARVTQILPTHRVSALTNCGDGSMAEAELAADFLRSPPRASSRRR